MPHQRAASERSGEPGVAARLRHVSGDVSASRATLLASGRRTPADVALLQRAAGNRAVSRLLARPRPDAAAGKLPVVQRRNLSQDRLNVAGENHDESADRRALEAELAADEGGGRYWSEEQFPVTITTPTTSGQVAADPLLLRWFHGVAFLSDFIDRIMQTYHELISGDEAWDLDTFKTQLNRVSGTTLNLLDVFAEFQRLSPEQASLHNAQSNIATVAAVLSGSGRVDQIKAAEASLRGKAMATGQALSGAAPSAHRAIVMSTCNVGPEIASLRQDVTGLADAAQHQLPRGAISVIRSAFMTQAAQDSQVRGLWKVGQAHVGHMAGMPEDQRNFNLLTEEEFNTEFSRWVKNRYSFEELRAYHPHARFG